MKNTATARTKKITSLFLALIMMLSVFAGFSMTAEAASSGCLLFDRTEEISFQESFHYTLDDAAGLREINKHKLYRIEIYSTDGEFNFDIWPVGNGKNRWANRSELSVDLQTGETENLTVSTDSEEHIKVRVMIYDVTWTPKRNSVKSLSAKKKQMTVKWGTRKGVTGYQVQYSANKSFKGKKSVTVKGAKKAGTTIKKLKRHKKYYIRVRTFNKVGGRKYYSDWSKPKSVNTK